jgi:hypothetical protein
VNVRRPILQIGDVPDFLWSRVDLPIPALPAGLEGLRILHLTDLHLRYHWLPSHERLVREIRQEKPDLILMTGDLIEHRHAVGRAGPHVHRLAAALDAPLGCYSVLGNHDGRHLAQHLVDTNIQLIDADWRRVQHGDATIELIGLPGRHPTFLTDQILAGYPAKQPGSLRIVLSHYPDHINRVPDADLVLAGHTHGGQICLPTGWPIIRHSRLPRRLCSGVNNVGDTWLIVGRGFGFAGWCQMRLFCPAEVLLLTLRRSKLN